MLPKTTPEGNGSGSPTTAPDDVVGGGVGVASGREGETELIIGGEEQPPRPSSGEGGGGAGGNKDWVLSNFKIVLEPGSC